MRRSPLLRSTNNPFRQPGLGGRHALQVLAHIDPPDIILLDCKMPVMTGGQFLARMRWNPELRRIPRSG